MSRYVEYVVTFAETFATRHFVLRSNDLLPWIFCLSLTTDHHDSQNQAKCGISVSIEAGGEEIMENQEQTGGPQAAVAPPF